ncbi:hypothetical protein ACFLVI_04085 [Chloroflexota bacterium]
MSKDSSTGRGRDAFEEIHTMRIGDRVIRRTPRKRTVLSGLTISKVFDSIRNLILQTPFLFMVPIIIILWLAFAGGLYWAEMGASGSNVKSYGEALWDGVVLMTTAGTMTEPVTTAGHVISAIWTVLGCIIFYGTIIASASAYFLLPLSSYFLLPRRGKQSKAIGTIQYNLGRIEELSDDEIESLKAETLQVIERSLLDRQHRRI